jgi:MFS family permease
VNHWFFKRRGMAAGIVTSGSSIGGVIWPIAINGLIKRIGFGWALRTCGFMGLVLGLISVFTVKSRLPPRKGPLFVLSLFKNPNYAFFATGMTSTLLGMFFLLFFLPTYGAVNGFSQNIVFYSASVVNAGSFVREILAPTSVVGQLAHSLYSSPSLTMLTLCSLVILLFNATSSDESYQESPQIRLGATTCSSSPTQSRLYSHSAASLRETHLQFSSL